MSKRNHTLFLEDIIQSMEKIEQYTRDLSLEEFRGSDMTVDATVRNLEIIGEAVNKIPKNIKDKYPDVEWKEAKSFS